MRKKFLLMTFLLAIIGFCGTSLRAETVTTEDALRNVLQTGGEVKLSSNIAITTTIVIPANITTTLDLNGYAITVPEADEQHIYAIDNRGNLTLKDGSQSEGGSITSRGIISGYYDNSAATAKLTVESGKYYGIDNGGAAIFNGAELVIDGGEFYGYRCAVDNALKTANTTINGGTFGGACLLDEQEPSYIVSTSYIIRNDKGYLTINDANVVSGFGAVGCYDGTTVIKDGSFLPTGWKGYTSHVVYVAAAANVTINGGTYKMNYPADKVPDSGSAVASYYKGTLEINGGSFTAHFDNVSPVELSEGSVIKGGSYYNHAGEYSTHSYITNYVAEGYELGENGEVENKFAAQIGDVKYGSLQAALDAAAAGTGNVTVEILRSIDLTDVDWNPVTVSGPNYPLVTVNGNSKTITGLNDMLFAGTWAGGSGLIINDLTIYKSTIINDKEDTKGTVGVGAFIGYPQASATITLNNCHLKESHVEGGHWTGGLIGMAGGYNGNDGPVFMNLTITNCSVTGSTITGKGSAGGIIGHGSCAAWTNVDINGTTVSGNTVTSTGSSTNKAGAVMGTIGAAGQPTTANGVTLTGGATVSATVSGNTVTSGGTTITTIYGRQGTETGMLELDGGSYDNYPIEEGVSYAAPAEGYEIEQNTDGTYGVLFLAVAQIGTKYYTDLHEAMVAAKSGETVILINDVDLAGTEWEPVRFAGKFDGKNKTIKNLTINKPGVENTGFITSLNGDFGNVTFENATVTGGECTAVVAGRAGGGAAYAHDITLRGTIKVETTHSGYARAGGIVGGWAYGKYENITVDGTDKATSYIKHTGGGDGRYVAGIVGHADDVESYTNCTVKNITISGGWLCGGIAGPGPADGLATECTVENIDMGAGYSGGMFGWYYGDGTIEDATIKDVTFTDGSTNNGAIGGYSNNEDATIDNVTITNVKNADGAPLLDHVAAIDDVYYTSFTDALNAAEENATITLLRDIKITERTVINNRTLTIDGKGKTIRQAEDFDNVIAMFDITGGKVTINNAIFEGVKKGAVVRTVNTEFAMDNVTAQNSEHTVGQGLFRLVGQNTITNSKFLNNNCSMVMTLNYDGTSETPQLIENCLFEGNECSSVAALYYVKGASCTIKDSEFIGNTVNCNNNGATVYLGFTENNVVTGNIFDSNNVIDASTSTRVAGAIFFGYEAEISNNVFVNNTASNANNDALGQICTSTYYECTIDLSGNYWGGEAPEYGKDYTVQHTASNYEGNLQLNDYYKTYTTDEEGNVVLDEMVNMNYVAQVGKFSYETLAEAFAAADNNTITILADVALAEIITIPNGKTVTLDLNGKTITGTDTTSKNFSIIDNRGTLTITDNTESKEGKITLTATVNSGWNRYSAVIANNPGGKLIIEAGTLEHLGGTDMAYGIDNLTNGKGTYAETIINGGTVKSPYRAIRQFLNGVEAQNILTVNGGTIEGDNKSIWMQDPSKNPNTGTLTVGENATLKGDVYLFVTAGSTEWPVEVSIAAAALAEGSEVMTGNVPAGYELQTDENNNYVVNGGFAKIGEIFYATLQEAVDAVEDNETIVLIRDNNENIVAGNKNQKPFNKIFTIDGADFNVTGKWVFGRDDHNQDESNVTIQNVNFTKYGVKVDDFASVTISGCTFTDVEGNAIYVAADEYTSSIVVENCVITNPAGAGINFRNPVNATINGNTITGAGNNGITFQHGTAYTEAETGNYVITNNKFDQWAESGEGRAIRIATGTNPRAITVENNVMIHTSAPEEFVKITGNNSNVSLDENYWNGANPTTENTPAYLLAEGVQVHNYYATYNAETNELSDLVTIAGETLELYYTAAGEETTQEQAAYSLMFNVTDYANKELSVKIGSMTPANNSNIALVTPETVSVNNEEYNVTAIKDNGFQGTDFVTMTISEGVKTIGEKAFMSMGKLTDLVFPSTLTYIGNAIFNGTEGSYSIKTVTTHAKDVPELEAKTSFPQWLNNKGVVLLVYGGDPTEYAAKEGWNRFHRILGIGSELEIAGKDDKYTMIATITSMDPMECSIKIGNTKPAANSNAELVIPKTVDFVESLEGFDFTVTSIPNSAFANCQAFVGDLVIPNSVVSIGESAFNTAYYCAAAGQGTLTLSENLQSIGAQAFKNVKFTNGLTIPQSVKNIAGNAFQYAKITGTLTVNGDVSCSNAFNSTIFNKVVLSEGVTTISEQAFVSMTDLVEVELPSTLEEVGRASFSSDPNITTIISKALNVPTIIYSTNSESYKHPFHATVLANATLWVVGESYDDVIAYKETAKWQEFDNIHLYGAVAAIEKTGYEYLSFQEAYEAVESGQTIVLLQNVELTSSLSVTENITLNLNGNNITADFIDSYGAIYVKKGAELTIEGEGNIASEGIAIGTYGTVNIAGGNITSGEDYAALYMFYYNSDFEGNAVITAGELDRVWNCGNLTIKGGNIAFLDNSSELTVESGIIENMYARDGSDVDGVYNMNIEDISLITNIEVPEGYVFKEVGDKVYQVLALQTTQLNAGWNWFSAYVDIDLESLQNTLGENATIIKNHTTGKWTKYEEGEWYGTLETISPKEMYIINTSNTIELTLVGELVELTPITIKNNWNAIGYMLNEPMSVESALNSIVPAHGDYIKSRDQYAAYDEIDGWYGTLETLIPGEGYMLKSNYSEDRLLTYSYPTRNSNSEVKDNITTDGNYWTPNHSQYPNNMTMTAMVEVEGGDYEVAAFVDGEVRGSARPIYVEALDAHILFLTIHGDETEEMTFRYYDIATGEEYELNDRINYSNDAIVGSLTEPYIFNRGTTGIGEASLSDINIYPNPTTTGTEINLQSTCDTVEVFNALGVKVAEYHNVDSIDAFETAGIYVIRITDNGDVKHCRLIVK